MAGPLPASLAVAAPASHAEEVHGKAFMRKYRKGESTIDGGGSRAEREAHAAG